jgi:hypothetical protein
MAGYIVFFLALASVEEIFYCRYVAFSHRNEHPSKNITVKNIICIVW